MTAHKKLLAHHILSPVLSGSVDLLISTLGYVISISNFDKYVDENMDIFAIWKTGVITPNLISNRLFHILPTFNL